MIKLTFYISLAIVLALGAAWFTNHPGTILFNWRGIEIQLSVAIFCLLLLAYSFCLFYLFKLYHWIKTDNPFMSQHRIENRRQKGLTALDLGWSALAVNDHNTALKKGKKALGFLTNDHGPIRLLLQASPKKDQKKYSDLLKQNKNTLLLSLNWALKQALLEKNILNALTIVQEMQDINPGNTWIMAKNFSILTRLAHWQEARIILDKRVKARAIDRTEYKRLAAVLYYSQALELDAAGQKTQAHNLAHNALKNNPEFIPAAVFLARHYLAHDNKSRAQKILDITWKKIAHPDLAQIFLKLDPMESPSEKFRRIEKFSKLNPHSIASLHLMAKVGIDTQHWPQAKAALDKILSSNRATRETYHLLAHLEILQRNDKKKADNHITQAQIAPPDPVWQCKACHATHNHYAAICPQCHSFGQIKWQGTP